MDLLFYKFKLLKESNPAVLEKYSREFIRIKMTNNLCGWKGNYVTMDKLGTVVHVSYCCCCCLHNSIPLQFFHLGLSLHHLQCITCCTFNVVMLHYQLGTALLVFLFLFFFFLRGQRLSHYVQLEQLLTASYLRKFALTSIPSHHNITCFLTH